MRPDEGDYYRTLGFLRAAGLGEAQAYKHAEEATMGPNEWNLQNIVADALAAYADEAGTEIKRRTYEDAGLVTRDKGLMVEVEGSRFQITIVKA
jgi:hypothetical protein